jgi:hypothetical protein
VGNDFGSEFGFEVLSLLRGEEIFICLIRGWRPDTSGLTPGYCLSRLRGIRACGVKRIEYQVATAPCSEFVDPRFYLVVVLTSWLAARLLSLEVTFRIRRYRARFCKLAASLNSN